MEHRDLHLKQEESNGDAIQHHGGIGVVNSEGKKDWHDWEAIAREEQRTGIVIVTQSITAFHYFVLMDSHTMDLWLWFA